MAVQQQTEIRRAVYLTEQETAEIVSALAVYRGAVSQMPTNSARQVGWREELVLEIDELQNIFNASLLVLRGQNGRPER